MKSFTTIFNENIHCPASYYLCSGYVPELGTKLKRTIDGCQITNKHSLIYMNEHTYNWMFRLFNYPCEQTINPIIVTAKGHYLFNTGFPIIINNELNDGMIIFDTGGNIELDKN